jgi:hypothetical protein
MPEDLSSSASQHMRWEQGKRQLARRYVPKLLAAAWQELRAGCPSRAFLLCDAVMEYLQPPFSILAGASLLSLVAGLAFFGFDLLASPWETFNGPTGLAVFNVLLAVGLLLGQGVYLFAGLRSVSAPKQVYLNLLYAPRLIVWKTWGMFLALFGRRQNSWIRTKRNEG